MPYDRTSYFEQRNERRNERLSEESYQRNLARARTGESAAAHAEGVAAQGLDSASQQEAAASGGGNPGAINTGAFSSRDYDPITLPDSLEDETEARPMARGGRYRAGEKLLVGDAGPEVIVPNRGGRVIPNNALPSGFRNTGALRLRNRNLANFGRTPTAPEATIQGHLIDERRQARTNRAQVEAADVTGRRDVEKADVTGQYHVEGQKVAAEPNLVQANVIRDKADREHLKTFNEERATEYDGIVNRMNANWPQTVARVEADYRAKYGREMPAETRASILQSDDLNKIYINKRAGTPEHKELLAMGLPKKGEAVRPGILIAHGYEAQKDGTWQKENVNPLSGTKYLDKFVPGAEGLERKEEMIRPTVEQGPGLYLEDGRWYGSRISSPQTVPPKVVTIEQALNPKFVASYNERAGEFGLPKVGNDLVAQNPEAAAWQVLTGINQINTGIGDQVNVVMGNDRRHLEAPTYVLSREDTKKAVAGHERWLNPYAPGPTAPAGTPPSPTPDIIRAAAAGAAAGAPGVAPVGPAPATVAPPETPAAPVAPVRPTNEAGDLMGSVWTPPPAPTAAPKLTRPDVEEAGGLFGVPPTRVNLQSLVNAGTPDMNYPLPLTPPGGGGQPGGGGGGSGDEGASAKAPFMHQDIPTRTITPEQASGNLVNALQSGRDGNVFGALGTSPPVTNSPADQIRRLEAARGYLPPPTQPDRKLEMIRPSAM